MKIIPWMILALIAWGWWSQLERGVPPQCIGRYVSDMCDQP
jgi:hypothetical protein